MRIEIVMPDDIVIPVLKYHYSARPETSKIGDSEIAGVFDIGTVISSVPVKGHDLLVVNRVKGCASVSIRQRVNLATLHTLCGPKHS